MPNIKGLGLAATMPDRTAGANLSRAGGGGNPTAQLAGGRTNWEYQVQLSTYRLQRGNQDTPPGQGFVEATLLNTGEAWKTGRRSVRSYGQEEMNAQGEYVYQGMQVPDSKENSFQNGSGSGNSYFSRRKKKEEKAEEEKNVSTEENLQEALRAASRRNPRELLLKQKKAIPLETWMKFSEVMTCSLVPLSCKLFGF